MCKGRSFPGPSMLPCCALPWPNHRARMKLAKATVDDEKLQTKASELELVRGLELELEQEVYVVSVLCLIEGT